MTGLAMTFLVLWGLALGGTALFVAVRQLRRASDAPAELQPAVRLSGVRAASQAFLRLSVPAVFIDLVPDDQPDWSLPLLLVAICVFIGTYVYVTIVFRKWRGHPEFAHWVEGRSYTPMPMSADRYQGAHDDPGWLQSLLRIAPFGGPRDRPAGASDNGLVLLRTVFAALLLAGILIVFVSSFVFDEIGAPEPAWFGLVVGVGLYGIAAALWTQRRPLDAHDSAALAQAYRTNFFLGFALNESAYLMAFVICFMVEALWPLLVAFPLWIIGMLAIAPGRRNLARAQQRIQRQGSNLSIGRVLSETPPARR